MKNNLGLITFLLILILTGVGLGIGDTYTRKKIEKDKQNFNLKINNLFQGKKEILDGSTYFFTGDFSDNDEMRFVFEAGGFRIYSLEKDNISIYKRIFSPHELTFKVPKQQWIPAQNIAGFIFNGYFQNNSRPSIQECIDAAFEDYLKINVWYTPGKLQTIIDFPNFDSEYHFMSQYGLIESHDSQGRFSTTAFNLDYKSENIFYEVKNKEDAINKARNFNLLTGSGIGLFIALIITLILKIHISQQGYTPDIINIKWRNKNDNSILIIKSKTEGTYPTTILKDNTALRGYSKIKGTNIEINFPDAEFYYKIEKIEKNVFELKNVINGQSTYFERLDSKTLHNHSTKT
jgi:hypothetical protein